MEIPKIDNRKYRPIVLTNKISVLLISDPETTESATSLSVNIGCNQDTIPGIAHFLEHMLFMGTHKYPQEDLYHKYIQSHGGVDNAYTDSELTNYHFKIKSEYFDTALEMFSRFFIDPLLKADAVDREINAVNAEHEKNILNDELRINRILEVVANKKHPFHHFSTGTIETLKRDDIREKLVDFYQKNYSANLMKLVVLDKKPLEEIEKIAIRLFTEVKNIDVPIPTTSEEIFIFDDSQKFKLSAPKRIHMVPIQDKKRIIFAWSLPSNIEHYRKKALHYISHVLGYQGENSLYHVLKRKQWIVHLNVGQSENTRNANIFEIDIELTLEGFRNTCSIINLVYETLKNIKIDGNVYNDMRNMSKIKFDFLDKVEPLDYVTNLSRNMIYYNIDEVISIDYKYCQFDIELIKMFLKSMSTQKVIILITSKSYENTTNMKEKYYGVDYIIYENADMCKFDTNELIELQTPDGLPSYQDFIPKSVDINKWNGIDDYPKKIGKSTWFQPDVYKRPIVNCGIIISSPHILKDVKSFMALNLCVNLLSNLASIKLYDASLADFEVKTSISGGDMVLIISGYNSTLSQSNILDMVIKLFFESDLEEYFDHIKTAIKKNFNNFIYAPPYLLSNDILNSLIYKYHYTPFQLLDIIDDIKIDDVYSIRQLIFKENSVKYLIQGNLSLNELLFVTDKLKIFNGAGTFDPPSDLYYQSINEKIHIQQVYNTDETNSAVNVYYKIKDGKKDYLLTGLTYILDTAIGEPFFSQLRTKEQLGYIAKTGVKTIGHNSDLLEGIFFLVQSPYKHPLYIKDRIDLFIKEFHQNIEKIDLNDIKEVVKMELLKPPDNAGEDFIINLGNIIKNEDLDRNKQIADKIDGVNMTIFKQFIEEYLLNRTNRWVIGLVGNKVKIET